MNSDSDFVSEVLYALKLFSIAVPLKNIFLIFKKNIIDFSENYFINIVKLDIHKVMNLAIFMIACHTLYAQN